MTTTNAPTRTRTGDRMVDPLLPEARAREDANALGTFPAGASVWLEETWMGIWQGTYRSGDFSHSTRYRYIGQASGLARRRGKK